MKRFTWMLRSAATLAMAAAAGCAASPDSQTADFMGACAPGEVFECACPSGSAGVQTCDDLGMSVSPCECGTTTTSPAAPLPPPASPGPPPPAGSPAPPDTGSVHPPSEPSELTDPAPAPPPPDPIIEPGPDPVVAPPPPGVVAGSGFCCADGNCLCHGPDPVTLTSSGGPYATAQYPVAIGTVHHPIDAEPPLAAVAIVGGFTNTGPEMAPWAPFYASHGIVTVVTTTAGLDQPDTRATKLLGAIDTLKAENDNPASPLFGVLAGRYGTSGYSMGGGGTTIASGRDPSLWTSVGLAAWSPQGAGVQVPTLLLCGSADTTAPCSMSQGAYSSIPESTPKMMVTISGASHFSWFGPTNAGGGISGEIALAFQKVFLEGDERWRPFLGQAGGTVVTNIQ